MFNLQPKEIPSDKCCSGKISEGILAHCGISVPHAKVKSWEGWIGHSLNPIGCLFEILVDASRNGVGKNREYKEQCHFKTKEDVSGNEA